MDDIRGVGGGGREGISVHLNVNRLTQRIDTKRSNVLFMSSNFVCHERYSWICPLHKQRLKSVLLVK